MNRHEWTQRNYYCWTCGNVSDLETHHMLRGVHRAAANKGLACIMRLCHRCHQGPNDIHEWPLVRQLAVKMIHDPANYDRQHVNTINTLSDKPDPERITEREVAEALNQMLVRHEVYTPQ